MGPPSKIDVGAWCQSYHLSHRYIPKKLLLIFYFHIFQIKSIILPEDVDKMSNDYNYCGKTFVCKNPRFAYYPVTYILIIIARVMTNNNYQLVSVQCTAILDS